MRESVKRIVVAFLFAVSVAAAIPQSNIVIMDPRELCKTLEKGSFLYILLGCELINGDCSGLDPACS